MNDAPKTAAVIMEILAGDGIGMGAAARLLPACRGEGRACPSTIWRWISKGHRLPSGEVLEEVIASAKGVDSFKKMKAKVEAARQHHVPPSEP